jgi:hypothetical protein
VDHFHELAGPPIRRRQALVAVAAALAATRVVAGPEAMAFQTLATPVPMAQIAAGGPLGLLGLGLNGDLFALPSGGGSARRLGGELDPRTPLAVGHGRIAARRSDGALWVLEGGRAAVSVERSLAPAAGLLVLAAAVIAVATEAAVQHLVRLEATGSGAWRIVARSAMAVLPDARPLQADLDASGDGGQLVVLAGPDSERYTHGVLGDAIEATRIVLLERHSLRLMRELALDAPHVFEDIAPRKVALGQAADLARDGLLTVQSGPQGAQLVLVDADPSAPTSLRIAARGPSLGMAHRWLSPTTDGHHWLAVHTPHIGGALHLYRQRGDQLLARRLQGNVANHRIGSRQLDLSAWQGQRLLIPEASGRRLLLLDAASDWRSVGELALASRVTALVGLGLSGRVAVLAEDGSVGIVSVAA